MKNIILAFLLCFSAFCYGGLLPLTPLKAAVAVVLPIPSSGLIAWYDAQTLSSITKDGSNNISQVTGRNGYGPTATSSGSNRPVYSASSINTNPAFTFNGSTQYLDLASTINLTTDGTIFEVVQMANVSGLQNVLGNDSTGQTIVVSNAGTSVELNDTTRFSDFNISATNGTPYIWETFLNATAGAAAFSVNNSAASSAGTGGAGNWSFALGLIGARTHSIWLFNGAIGEIIVYNRALSGGEITTVYNYLHARWGI